MKVVGLPPSNDGCGSRVDRMRVAPTGFRASLSGVWRGSPRFSTVQVRPAPMIVTAPTRTLATGGPPALGGTRSPVDNLNSSRASTGSTSQSTSALASIATGATPAAALVTPVTPVTPPCSDESVHPSLTPDPSSGSHVATMGIEPMHLHPSRGPGAISHSAVQVAMISSRFSVCAASNLGPGRTLVASDMTSATPRRALSVSADHCAPGPTSASAAGSSSPNADRSYSVVARSGSGRRPPVLLVDMVPRGSLFRCLDSSSPSVEPSLVPVLPLFGSTPPRSHGSTVTPSRLSQSSPFALPASASEPTAFVYPAGVKHPHAPLPVVSGPGPAVQPPTSSVEPATPALVLAEPPPHQTEDGELEPGTSS
jgi:hypothetical protein